MSDPVTMPPQPSPTAPPPQGQAPAFDPKAVFDSFVGVLTRPAAFYEAARSQKGFGPAVIFALVMGVIVGVITAVYAVLGFGAAAGPLGAGVGAVAGLLAIIYMPILYLIGCFIGGAIVHVIAMIAGGKGTFEQSVLIAAYASAVAPVAALLLPIPVIGTLVHLYGLYLVALGIIAIHAADRQRTFIVTGILAALVVIVSVAGYFTARAARHFSEEMGARSAQFQAEMQRSAEQMQKAAEQVRKAQEAQEAAQQPQAPQEQPAQ